MTFIIIGDAQAIREFICGPEQHNRHCKEWRWHIYCQGDRQRWRDVLAEQRQIAQEHRERLGRSKCGSCKATGIEHAWDSSGSLAPTGKACPICEGTGFYGLTAQQRADIMLAEHQAQRRVT